MKKVNFEVYHLYDIPQTSFINTNQERNRLYKSIEVQGVTIKNICLENNISHIDFMSIDVEGHDLEVLQGIDFNKLHINVLTIENNREPLFGDDKIRDFMKDKKYKFYARIHHFDDIYVHEDFLLN